MGNSRHLASYTAGALALLLAVAVGCGSDDLGDSEVEPDETAEPDPETTAPPVLENLLFDIQPCQTPNCNNVGGVGGDVLYGGELGWSAPLVFGFDFQLPDKPLNPTYEFYVALDAPVLAPVSGEITAIGKSQNDEDFGISIHAAGSGDYMVMIDHIQNLAVEVGDIVEAGEVLGTAGIWSELQGRTELQINNNYNDHSICPFDLLAEDLKDDYADRLADMFSDFETVRGEPELYDESSFALPGCLYVSFHNP